MTTPKWLPVALFLASCAPTMEPTSSGVEPLSSGAGKTLAYGENPLQVLDLYAPSDKKGAPLVVFVHGGAWQSGSRNEYDSICAVLMKRGVAAATVDYRLSPSVTHPSHADDVAAALGWLGGKASEYGYDARRVFVVGHSAGAHIAATIATNAKLLALAKPAGFVGLEGIYDVPDLVKRWPTYPDWFLKKAFGSDMDQWPKSSPTRLKLISKNPWLIVHSKADELVDMGQADAFAKHLVGSGVEVKVLRPDGKNHFGVVSDLARPDDEVAEAIVKFIDRR